MTENKGYCWEKHKFNPNTLTGKIANTVRNNYGAMTDQMHPMDQAYEAPLIFEFKVFYDNVKTANEIRKKDGLKEAIEFFTLASTL
jgi:hypothetical protein